ncbi:MAG: FMN-binding protein [Aurantimicrobium sp.]|uniref:FMN-binding protein n=1 Tax=Aurantimicrobium sp. TaxID=1930784 RepID=UPI002FCC3E4F
MRAGSAFLAGVGSAAIVAIGWQAGVGTLVSSLPQSQAAASGTTAGASSSTSSNSATTDTSSQATTTAPVASGPADGTYDGAVINTRYGAQQVQVVISSGQISDVIVLQTQTADRKSEQISSRANPILREEVLSAQSAQVANVSGATYTSQSYMQSLQSALDAAGFTG